MVGSIGMSQALTRELWLPADWPAPAGIYAGTSRRRGGVSTGSYASLNLALHVGDLPEAVLENRRRLGLPAEPLWLNQIHGDTVVDAGAFSATKNPAGKIEADAAYTTQAGVICAVLTADCLPILFCDRRATCVAAAHAGWRGLAGGIIERTVAALKVPGEELLAWLGPAIGPRAYEVGGEVRDAFVQHNDEADSAFTSSRAGHWWMDMYQLARQRLQQCGVRAISGGDHCTWQEADDFYSYRRDGVTGRMASVIWIETNQA